MTDLHFTIPNQMRRGLAASRLKREGNNVTAEATRADPAAHPWGIRDSRADRTGAERLSPRVAPKPPRSF